MRIPLLGQTGGAGAARPVGPGQDLVVGTTSSGVLLVPEGDLKPDQASNGSTDGVQARRWSVVIASAP
jgi:hypothetical protein